MTALDESFETFAHEAFRFEAMPHYVSAGESRAIDDFLNGRAPQSVAEHSAWLDLVRESTSPERRVRRVRIVDDPLTDYQRFQLDWAYPQNAEAGEEIRTVPRAVVRALLTAPSDFWLFDEQWGLDMVYDYRGHFLYAQELTALELERALEVRAATLNVSRALQGSDA